MDTGAGGCLPPSSISLFLLTWEDPRAAQASILPAWQPPIRGCSAVALETPVAITAADGGIGEADGSRGGQPGLAERDGHGWRGGTGTACSDPSLESEHRGQQKGNNSSLAETEACLELVCDHLSKILSHFITPPAATMPQDYHPYGNAHPPFCL